VLKRIATITTTVAVAAVVLAGCSTAAGPASSSAAPTGSPSATAPAAAALTTASSPLGEIIADEAGYTVYTFTKDSPNSGVSNCYDDCAMTWPAVSASSTSAVDGVTGEVGSITRTDGTTQLTVNGWPIYRFAKDAAPGQVNGQGVKDAWYVLLPDGTTNKEAAGASTPTPTP
jgi:predicted lipoprotein with Yx(FWY)xxD motif